MELLKLNIQLQIEEIIKLHNEGKATKQQYYNLAVLTDCIKNLK